MMMIGSPTSGFTGTTLAKTMKTMTTRRYAANAPRTVALGGFGPNVSAEEIRRKQEAKKKLIEANKAKALAAKSAQKPSNAFSARKNSQQTIASVPARKNRTMPGAAAKKPATIGSKTIGFKKTVSSKAKDAEPKKKLFGLF